MSDKKNLSEKSNFLEKTDSLPTSVAFIHNFLDEYGLDPYEFRIYTHMVRRTGGKEEGVCFASLKKTAQICKMSVRKAQQALKFLIQAKLLEQTKREGRTDEYRVLATRHWAAKEELDNIRQAIMNNKNEKVTEADLNDLLPSVDSGCDE
ncbi:helix-turn-helix domain-containing protein [Cylindrospermum sp. FACHB-282]|uniref:helix-turn-helix domain-containing protein n=1 Tax=Cylindrospermum sp. FACHB-282 TaxID=2692794 RepID=UPI0016861259|nr:helix-turn-helix domain-containing protein [Cylindrospermum sp. FACHB-282]MBD2386749.1 helix-turn-helix domain-containing protein [Cylindrospermum sp. FACHB-282]